MVNFMAMFCMEYVHGNVLHGIRFCRVSYVHSVHGRIQLVSWPGHTLLVSVKYHVVSEPAAPAKFAGHEVKIGQHVCHHLRMCLGNNSNVVAKPM